MADKGENKMGYCINMTQSDFTILNGNKDKALKLLKGYAKKHKNISWVGSDVLINSNTLIEALEECRYEAEEDNEGNIVDISFTGNKLGEDEFIFNAIAPAVEDNSYIEMHGEDGCIWRWVFKGGQCKEVNGKIDWNN